MSEIIVGDCLTELAKLPAQSVHCCVTSPPYWGLRDYGTNDQIGLEATPGAFVAKMVSVFAEVKRVLRDDGTLWMNMGDSYNAGTSAKRKAPKTDVDVGGWNDAEIDGGARVNCPGLKPKDLMGMPWMLAFALRADGWFLRSDIVWNKPNPMPESVTDRPTKSHEYIFLLTKSQRYYFDQEAVRLPPSGISGGAVFGGMKKGTELQRQGSGIHGRFCEQEDRDRYMTTGANIRTVWPISTQNFPGAHFATFPEKLVEPCILAGTSERGCCSECGAPFRRILDKSIVPTKKAAKTFIVDKRDHAADRNDQGSNRQKDGHKSGYISANTTTGWQPGCECGAASVPCTVLDPFFGAGTTGLVAAKLGREYVGIELNPEYAAMAEARIRNRNSVGAAIEPARGQAELF